MERKSFTQIKLSTKKGMVELKPQKNHQFQIIGQEKGVLKITEVPNKTWVKVVTLEPDFVIQGFTYVRGSLKNYDLVFSDKEGNEFKFVSGNKSCDSFWYSCYSISIEPDTFKVRSIAGKYPLTLVSFNIAMELAKEYGGILPSNEQYDRICQEMVESGALTYYDIFEDSTSMGNYFNNPEGLKGAVAKTGSNPKWCHNGIYDFSGNVCTWTTQYCKKWFTIARSFRGGSFNDVGNEFPIATKEENSSPEFMDEKVGLRIVLDREHCSIRH